MSEAPGYLRATFDYYGAVGLAKKLREGIDAGDPDIRAAEELMTQSAEVMLKLLDQFCRLYPAFKAEHLRTKCGECHERLGPLCATCEAKAESVA